MKVAVSTICGLSNESISDKIDVDAFEVVRLNYNSSCNVCSAQSIFYGLYNLRIFESVKSVDLALDSLDWCKNIPNIVFGYPKLRVINNTKELDNAKAFFSEYTERYDNIIAIEPLHSSYGTNFATSYDETVDFINKLNNERVRVNLDLGSCAINHEIVNNIDLINHVHISGKHLSAISEDDMTYYKNMVYLLYKLGYNKFISLESLHFEEDINKFKEIIFPYSVKD